MLGHCYPLSSTTVFPASRPGDWQWCLIFTFMVQGLELETSGTSVVYAFGWWMRLIVGTNFA